MREPINAAGGTEAMGMAAFQSLLEQYGAEPRRWPAALRAPALALLATSVPAQVEQQRAARLDALLDRLDAPVISDERVARVVARSLGDLPVAGLVRRPVPFAARAGTRLAGMWRLWPRAAGLAACTAAGILVGAITPAASLGGGGMDGQGAMAATADAHDLPSALFTPSPLESLFQ